MFINNRLASLVFKIVIAVVSFIGLILSSGLANGTFVPYVLLYYTILSNLFCLVFYIVSAVVTGLNIKNTGKYGVVKFAPHFKGGVVMAMVLAMLVYFFVLATPNLGTSVFSVIANLLVHILVPLMVIVDWALFDRKGRFFPSDPIIWLAVPFVYYCLVLVAAQFGVSYYGGTQYPYPFINPDYIGWARVLVNVAFLTLAYLAAGYILFGADKLLGNRAKKKAMEAAGELPDMEAVTEIEVSAIEVDGITPAGGSQTLGDVLSAGNLSPAAPAPPAGQPTAEPAPAPTFATQQATPMAQPAQRPVTIPTPQPQNNADAGKAPGTGE